MSKCIDADKLLAKIEYLKGINIRITCEANKNYCRGYADSIKDILHAISTLQQEQPMPDSTKLIELWHEDKEMLKEKDFRDDPWRLAYNAFMCGFGRGIAVNKQDLPGVDLEREIIKYKVPFSDDREYLNEQTLDAIARHFYELGLNAKK